MLPVTHTEPNHPDLAIEIPATVKKHLGLDDDQSWIILSESNEFLWPGRDLRRVANGDNSTVVYGFLPPKLFNNIRQRFLAVEERRRTTRVMRTE